jgi:transcriptional regulator with XRE-family HTH domain
LVQESLGHKLRILRAERQMSLRRAAAEAGLAKETISEIERGLTHPHDVTLAKLARAYNVPVEDLLEVSLNLAKLDTMVVEGRRLLRIEAAVGRLKLARVWREDIAVVLEELRRLEEENEQLRAHQREEDQG